RGSPRTAGRPGGASPATSRTSATPRDRPSCHPIIRPSCAGRVSVAASAPLAVDRETSAGVTATHRARYRLPVPGQESAVATLAITIDLPPTGELETSGNGSSPTQAQQDEEMKARQYFIDLVSPYLESLPERPPHRAGNVSRSSCWAGMSGQSSTTTCCSSRSTSLTGASI